MKTKYVELLHPQLSEYLKGDISTLADNYANTVHLTAVKLGKWHINGRMYISDYEVRQIFVSMLERVEKKIPADEVEQTYNTTIFLNKILGEGKSCLLVNEELNIGVCCSKNNMKISNRSCTGGSCMNTVLFFHVIHFSHSQARQ